MPLGDDDDCSLQTNMPIPGGPISPIDFIFCYNVNEFVFVDARTGEVVATLMPRIVSRADWTDRNATFSPFTRDVTRIVMHHTVTNPTAFDYELGEMTIAQIVRNMEIDHIRRMGWTALGYHFVIGYDGTIFEGRPMDVSGNHALLGRTYNRNPFTIGVALIGDFGPGNEPPSQAQLDSLFSLTSYILDRISTIDTIECHWDTYFGPWYSSVQDDLREKLR